jgi:hypothetical protein
MIQRQREWAYFHYHPDVYVGDLMLLEVQQMIGSFIQSNLKNRTKLGQLITAFEQLTTFSLTTATKEVV